MRHRMTLWMAMLAAALLLAPLAPAATLRPGEILVVDPGASTPFLPDGPADGAIFVVHPLTGERRILSGQGVGSGPALQDPWGITITADRASIYVTDRSYDVSGDSYGVVYRIDPETGNRFVVSGPGTGSGPTIDGIANVGPLGITVGAGSTLYVTSTQQAAFPGSPNGAVFRIDASSGARELVSGQGMGSGTTLEGPVGIDALGDGTLIVADPYTGDIVQIDSGDGSRSEVLDTGAEVMDLVSLQDNTLIYTTIVPSQVIRYFPSTDASELIGGGVFPSPLLPLAPIGVADARDGKIYVSGYYDSGTNTGVAIGEIDLATLDWRIVSASDVGTGPQFGDVAFLTVVPVPEPAAWALACLGMAALLMHRRVRNGRAAIS